MLQKSPKNWGGKRRLQLEGRGSYESCRGKIERSGDCSLSQWEGTSATAAGLSFSDSPRRWTKTWN